jgi:DNA-binding winged helix-turn-helix (wHTH) protein/TolB-like protein/Tfp pilus assembly protein PilF
VNLREGELRKAGIKIKLYGQPFEILVALLERPGELVTREELRQRLWPPDVFVDVDLSLNKAINRLREALGDSAENPRFIETSPRRGYRFIADVSIERVGSRGFSDSLREHWQFALSVTALFAVLAGIVVVSVYSRFIARAPIRTVAVLPFKGSGAYAENLRHEITSSLIDSLSQLPEVKVISHASTIHYEGKEIDPRAVGHELGVSAVVIGEVVTHGDTLSMSVELVSTRDNTRLWGAQYARKISDVVAMRRDISQELGKQLRPHLPGDLKRRLSEPFPEDSEAYHLYLRGRYYWYKGTPESYETARQYYEKAIEKDPAYALAYAALASYYFVLAGDGLSPPREVFPKARASAHKALAIDPNLGPGHSALGGVALYYDWNLPEAEREFKRAIELAPNWEATYRNYAICLRAMGRLDEAIAANRQARELDPFSVGVNISLGWTYYYAHRFPEAVEQFRTTVAMDPSSMRAQFGLANAYQQNRMEKESIQAWQTYITASGSSEFASELGNINAASGYSTAIRIIRQAALDANTTATKHGYISPMVFAGLHAALGNKDEAFAWLDNAYAERSSELLDLKLDPDFDSLREDPRYAELLRHIGLP